ncbi:MAG: transcription elongation factor Spt5 [Candidatus Micrarchaeia archaeon]
MLFAYRVTAGQESIVADLLHEKARKKKVPINAFLISPRLKGYLIVESTSEVEAKQLITNVPHVKSVLPQPIPFVEIKSLLESKPAVVNFNKGDLVEVTNGPFKGERAKVVRIDPEKDDVTVELVEVAVPIPVTIKTDAIKLLPQ